MNMECPWIFQKILIEMGECHGVKFAVDGDSSEYLKGTEIHFDDGLSGKGFELRNPNAQTTLRLWQIF